MSDLTKKWAYAPVREFNAEYPRKVSSDSEGRLILSFPFTLTIKMPLVSAEVLPGEINLAQHQLDNAPKLILNQLIPHFWDVNINRTSPKGTVVEAVSDENAIRLIRRHEMTVWIEGGEKDAIYTAEVMLEITRKVRGLGW